MELPEFVKSKITELAQRKGYTVEDLTEYFMEIYTDSWIQSLPEEIRFEQSLKILTSRVATRPPLKTFEIIPVGFSPLNRNGDSSVLFAFVKGKGGIQRILCRDKYAKIWEFIDLFMLYSVKLEETSNVLQTDPRTKWDNRKPLEIEPTKLLEKVPKVSISEIASRKSTVTSTGFIDSTDWRCVKAIITRRTTSKDGRIAVYTVWDESVEYEEVVLPDGTVVSPGLTVWCNPVIARWDVDSECLFYGDVRTDKNGLPFMNAYLILPEFAREIEEVKPDE